MFTFRASKPNPVVWEVGVGNLFLSRTRDLWQRSHLSFTLFEANPSLYKELTARVAHYPNVRVLNLALHNEEGFRNLYLASDRSFLEGTHSPMQQIYHGRFEQLMGGFKVPVYCARMDHYDLGDIDILFVGVEGNEWNVLRHMVSRPALIMTPNYYANDYRYAPPHAEEMAAALDAQGYRLLLTNPDQVVYFNPASAAKSGVTYTLDERA